MTARRSLDTLAPLRLRESTLSQKGQALVEAAIVLPFVIFFIIIIIETVLLANAKSLVRYAAFCAARSASVSGVGQPEELRKAAVIPLLAVAGRSIVAEEALALLGGSDFDPGFSEALRELLSPGQGWAPHKPMPFNRDLSATISQAWVRTHVETEVVDGEARAQVLYFHSALFPLSRITRLVNEAWEMVPSDIYKQKIESVVGAGYEQWRKSNLIPLFATVSLPLEKESSP